MYVFVRFNGRNYAIGAIASLAHDVLVVLSMFSLLHSIVPFSLEVDQAFIAAILTVIGYSINDTVIVFDRMREYTNENKKGNLYHLFNNAINSTLSRTFNTSFTTLITLFAIFMFGGASLRGFIFALLVGIGIGTYSSVFVAAPLAYDALPKSKREGTEEASKKK